MGMSGGFTEVDLVARQFEKVKHNSTKWVDLSSMNCWNSLAQF